MIGNAQKTETRFDVKPCGPLQAAGIERGFDAVAEKRIVNELRETYHDFKSFNTEDTETHRENAAPASYTNAVKVIVVRPGGSPEIGQRENGHRTTKPPLAIGSWLSAKAKG